jgi:hypothetical protein
MADTIIIETQSATGSGEDCDWVMGVRSTVAVVESGRNHLPRIAEPSQRYKQGANHPHFWASSKNHREGADSLLQKDGSASILESCNKDT